MKRTTLIKAVAGAGALFLLGTGVAYAADADKTTTTTVTVTGTRTITLAATGADTNAFDVANALPLIRSQSGVALVHTGNTYSLAFATDYDGYSTGTTDCLIGEPTCTGDQVTVVATGDPLNTTNGITLHVIPGTIVGGGTGSAGTPATGNLTATGAVVPLITALDGRVTHVSQTYPITFTADASSTAVIGAHANTLTYTIAAKP